MTNDKTSKRNTEKEIELFKLLKTPIYEFKLPPKIENIYNKLQIDYLFEILKPDDKTLLKIKGFGKVSLKYKKEIINQVVDNYSNKISPEIIDRIRGENFKLTKSENEKFCKYCNRGLMPKMPTIEDECVLPPSVRRS